MVRGNLIFNHVRETVDHGVINGWERGPYLSDIGMVRDPSSNVLPSAEDLQTGALPGFKLDSSTAGGSLFEDASPSNLFVCLCVCVCMSVWTSPTRAHVRMDCNRVRRRAVPTFGKQFPDGQLQRHVER